MNFILQERFWSKVKITAIDKCWLWTGAKTSRGYGNFRINAHMYSAHRVSFFLSYGFIDDTLVVMHSCDNPPCCNPKHLSLGTNFANIKDMHLKNRWTPGGRPLGISEDKIKEVEVMYRSGLSQYKIADLFGVSQALINRVLLRRESYARFV